MEFFGTRIFAFFGTVFLNLPGRFVFAGVFCTFIACAGQGVRWSWLFLSIIEATGPKWALLLLGRIYIHTLSWKWHDAFVF
jgi:hypothetical protein